MVIRHIMLLFTVFQLIYDSNPIDHGGLVVLVVLGCWHLARMLRAEWISENGTSLPDAFRSLHGLFLAEMWEQLVSLVNSAIAAAGYK